MKKEKCDLTSSDRMRRALSLNRYQSNRFSRSPTVDIFRFFFFFYSKLLSYLPLVKGPQHTEKIVTGVHKIFTVLKKSQNLKVPQK